MFDGWTIPLGGYRPKGPRFETAREMDLAEGVCLGQSRRRPWNQQISFVNLVGGVIHLGTYIL